MVPINHFGRNAIVITSAFTLLSAITVLLRLYTRLCIVGHRGAEDYLVILGMVCSTTVQISGGQTDSFPVLLLWMDYFHWYA